MTTTTTPAADAYDVKRVAMPDHPGVHVLSVRRRDGEAFTRFSDLFSIKETHAPDADVTSVDLWTWLRDAQHAAEAARTGDTGNGAPDDPDVAKGAAATINPPAAAHAASISVPPRAKHGGTLNLSRGEVTALDDHLASWLAGAPNDPAADDLRAIQAKLERLPHAALAGSEVGA